MDLVDAPEQFKPGSQYFRRKPYLTELVLLPGGKTPKSSETWTKGAIMHTGDRSASHYEIKELVGTNFMFLEWKAGEYTYLRAKPSFYVLRKIGGVARDGTEPAGVPAN